jgi:hypothetical protein
MGQSKPVRKEHDMEPRIDTVRFGAITVAGKTIRHDIVITAGGEVRTRKKGLSKQQYGTSHVISLAEIRAIWQRNTEILIVGTGMFGRVRLSPDAQAFLSQQGCCTILKPIGKAVRLWNDSQGRVAGLFHITC